MDPALYLPVKQVHVTSVHLSISLFILRGLLMLAGSGWLRHWSLRALPHVVDTVLLASALMLMSIVRQYPFVHHWLTVKVVLLLVYIGLGLVALKRGRTRATRATFWVAALLVFLFIYSVARTHNPWGVFSLLGA